MINWLVEILRKPWRNLNKSKMNAAIEMTTEGNEDDYGSYEDDFARILAPENKFL